MLDMVDRPLVLLVPDQICRQLEEVAEYRDTTVQDAALSVLYKWADIVKEENELAGELRRISSRGEAMR